VLGRGRSGIAAAVLGEGKLGSTALNALGGAINRATIALLWLGRGVFVVTTLVALYCAGLAAYTRWTMPQEWPGNYTAIVNAMGPTAGRHLKTRPSDAIPSMKLKPLADLKLEAAAQRTWEVMTPDGRKYEFEAPANASAADVADYVDKQRLMEKRVFPVGLPDKRVLEVETYNDEELARTGAREWWDADIRFKQKFIDEKLVAAFVLFVPGLIFLGFTRVTRWILTGK
jgi:hypothetical protein